MLNKTEKSHSAKWLCLICFTILFLPISGIVPIKGSDIWYTQYLTLFLILFFGISLKLWELNRIISVFVFYSTLSTVFLTHMHARSVFVLIQTALCALAVLIVSKIERRHVNKIFLCVLTLVFLQGVYVVMQYFGLDPFFHSVKDSLKDDTVGMSGNHNQIGLFFAMTAPLVIYYCPIFLLITAFGIYCSTTTIAYCALVFSVLYYAFFKFRRYFIGVLCVFVVISGFYLTKVDVFSQQKLDERVRLWTHIVHSVETGQIRPRKGNVIQIVESNKWLGFGNGSFMMLSPYAQKDIKIAQFLDVSGEKKEFSHVYEHAHNDYFETYFDLGRIGLILLIMFILDLFNKFIRSKKTKILLISFGCLVSFMICVTFIYGTQTALSGSLLTIFLGIFLGEVRRQRHGSPILA